MGTVELTGFEMMATQARGQVRATASHRPLTIDALMLNRSSRVMPGLRGTPVCEAGVVCGLVVTCVIRFATHRQV